MASNGAQQTLVAFFSERAAKWISEYGIDPNALDPDEVEELSKGQRKRLWSAQIDWVNSIVEIDGIEYEYREGFPLVPGFEKGCDEYYLGTKDATGANSSSVFQELRVACSSCDGKGQGEDGDECESCDGEAELIFDLDFESGKYL